MTSARDPKQRFGGIWEASGMLLGMLLGGSSGQEEAPGAPGEAPGQVSPTTTPVHKSGRNLAFGLHFGGVNVTKCCK